MRRRLIAALAGVAILTLLLYAAPRAFMIAGLVRQQEERALDRSADLVARTVNLRLDAGEAVDDVLLGELVRGSEEILVRFGDGTTAQAGVTGDLGTLAVMRELTDGGEVTLRLANEAVDRRVAEAMVPVVAMGSVVILFAVLLAVALSRQLSRPFTELARYTDRMWAEGARDAPRSGVPEADQLADALDRSRERVVEMVRREREFSANASHQLRTPLTALRLRLEHLTLGPETSETVRAELDASLHEVDRLAGTVTDLLELARSGGIGVVADVDLHATVGEATARWRPRFDEVGRRLVVRAEPDRVMVATSPRAVHQVLDVLLENALRHGEGHVDVHVRLLDGRATVCVADEGGLDGSETPRLFERSYRSSASRGSGIGLALARGVAESVGARLRVVTEVPTAFELSIPEVRGSTTEDPTVPG
jgi:signal transduction histidine kinase